MKTSPKYTISKSTKIFFAAVFVFLGFNLNVFTQTQTFTNTTTFTVPAGITSVTVECWGAGGRGGSANTPSTSKAGGGGGGGAYSKKIITVTSGTTYDVVVGIGGYNDANLNGGDSYFINNTTVVARGGKGVSSNTTTGGAGGTWSSADGTTGYAGGIGVTGVINSYSGGGGSSSGTSSNGVTGVQNAGGIAPAGGGSGGNGTTSNNIAGTVGAAPGGGGGGAKKGTGTGTPAGGNGANGKVVISWGSGATYCTPTISNPGYADGITLVQFNTINNPSGCVANTTKYIDNTAISTSVNIGSSYTLTVNQDPDGTYTQYARAWIDWNQNGVFDASESYNLGATINTAGISSASPFSITVPLSAIASFTRMRIASQYSSDPTNPCSISDGEVEDYSIVVLPGLTTGIITGSPFNQGDAVSIPYTVIGSFNASNVFTAQLSDASGSFTSPVTVGSKPGTTTGVIDGIIPISAVAGSGYRIRVVASNPVVTAADNGANLIIIDGSAINLSVNTISGFNYVYQSGPSVPQKFTINVLTTNTLSVSPPLAYEICRTISGEYETIPIILSPVSGEISENIYVRLKKDLTVGTYGPQTINLTCTGFTPKTVTCTGTVSPFYPTIVVGYKSGIPTDNYYVINGTDRKFADEKLLNPANFGGSTAPSPYTFVLYDFGSTEITEAGLIANGVQILDLGINTPDAGDITASTVKSYSAAELAAIKSWTIGTPNRVVLAFQGVSCNLGGALFTGSSKTAGVGNPNQITTEGHAIINGPFDFTSDKYDQGGAYQAYYTSTGDGCALVKDAQNAITGCVNTTTGDIYLADVGFVGVTGGLTNDATITSLADKFFANIYHGLARIVQYGPDGICNFFSCPAGINAPALNSTNLSIVCPATSANLTILVNGTPPVNTTLVWFTNPSHTGVAYTTPTAATAGTYYAFYYSLASDCYSPASLPVVIQSGITISTTTLVGFSYIVGAGPSVRQKLYVSGSCLDADIVLTPPTNFEISLDGTSYQNTAISLTKSGSNVTSTPIYVRLKAGLAVYDYPGNIEVSSLNATTKYVALFGTVINQNVCSSSGTTVSQKCITWVNFNTINNSSSKPSGYTDYGNNSTDVIVNTPYPLSVRLNTIGTNTMYCMVWIDWNHNGIFGDTGESYQLGTVYNSANGLTSLSPLTVTVPATATVGFCRMRVSSKLGSYSSSCESSFDGEVEDYQINVMKNYWRGNINYDWATADNWTAKYVPINGERVEFSTGTPYSVAVNNLVLDKNRTIGDLTNLSPMRLEIPTGTGLTINGAVSTGSNPDRILIKSGPPPAVNGSLIFPNALAVQATVEMYSRAQKITPITVGATTYKYAWQFFGIPVTTLTASPTFDGSYVREYQENKQGQFTKWVALTNTSTLLPTKGYEITQDAPKTIVFKGELINTDKTISLTKSSDALVFDQGHNIVSNPYTASINVRNLVFTNAEAVVYLYNTGSFGSWSTQGGLSTYDEASATAGQYLAIPKRAAGIGVDLPNEIPSMSGFLVKATSTTGSVAITYSTGTTNNVYAQRVKAANTNTVANTIVNTTTDTVADNIADDVVNISCTTIDVSCQHAADKMWIITESSCTNEFDNGWDGPKIMGSALSPQIYAVEPDGNYQVNSISDMNNTELGFQAGQDDEYTFTFNHQNLDKRYAGVYLVDLVTNKTVDVKENGSVYSFLKSIVPTPEKRFRIVTRPYEKNASDKETQVKIFSSESSIFIQNFGDVNGECRVYDIAGHYLMKVPFVAKGVTSITRSLRPGAYIAVAVTGGEKVSKQLMVR